MPRSAVILLNISIYFQIITMNRYHHVWLRFMVKIKGSAHLVIKAPKNAFNMFHGSLPSTWYSVYGHELSGMKSNGRSSYEPNSHSLWYLMASAPQIHCLSSLQPSKWSLQQRACIMAVYLIKPLLCQVWSIRTLTSTMYQSRPLTAFERAP